MTVEEVLKRLDAAMMALEGAVMRRREVERRSSDLETELALMQDDRARLAVELDGTLAKLNRLDAAADEANRRVERAMGAVREVVGRASLPSTQQG